MFPKALGIAYLREAITMMVYKIKFNEEYKVKGHNFEL
jgi:hypothetical protein